MANKAAIISAADERFFSLLRGLIQSLRDQGCADRADLCVIDIGLTPPQRAEIAALVSCVADGKWDLQFPGVADSPRWFQAMVVRPHLPDYFPGYDIYAWIDADAWVADARAVDLMLSAAREEGLVLVPEIHTVYRWHYTAPEAPPRQNMYRCYASGWGESIAQTMSHMPVLNSGAFAMPGDHPGWKKWSARLQEGVAHTQLMLVEQCALNMAVYRDGVQFTPLPAWCNWICHQAVPRYNADKKRFEEPMRPYIPLSIVHAGDMKGLIAKYRSAGDGVIDGVIEVPFNYLALKNAGLI